MRISDIEIQKLLARQHGEAGEHAASDVVRTIDTIGSEADLRADEPLVKRLTEEVLGMPDREELISDLRARIESGNYRPSGSDIADAMIRRSIADRLH